MAIAALVIRTLALAAERRNPLDGRTNAAADSSNRDNSLAPAHSIISSAVASKLGGTAKSSAFRFTPSR